MCLPLPHHIPRHVSRRPGRAFLPGVSCAALRAARPLRSLLDLRQFLTVTSPDSLTTVITCGDEGLVGTFTVRCPEDVDAVTL